MTQSQTSTITWLEDLLRELADVGKQITLSSVAIVGPLSFYFVLDNPDSRLSMTIFVFLALITMLFVLLSVWITRTIRAWTAMYAEPGTYYDNNNKQPTTTLPVYRLHNMAPCARCLQLFQIIQNGYVRFITIGIFTGSSIAFITQFVTSDGTSIHLPMAVVFALTILLVVAIVLSHGKTGKSTGGI